MREHKYWAKPSRITLHFKHLCEYHLLCWYSSLCVVDLSPVEQCGSISANSWTHLMFQVDHLLCLLGTANISIQSLHCLVLFVADFRLFTFCLQFLFHCALVHWTLQSGVGCPTTASNAWVRKPLGMRSSTIVRFKHWCGYFAFLREVIQYATNAWAVICLRYAILIASPPFVRTVQCCSWTRYCLHNHEKDHHFCFLWRVDVLLVHSLSCIVRTHHSVECLILRCITKARWHERTTTSGSMTR